MIRVRDVFQAKYGKGDELVALFKESREQSQASTFAAQFKDYSILTDASGPFFTVVTEYTVDSLNTWERFITEEFGSPQFAEWFNRMVPLVESGRREFYYVVA